MNPHRFPHLPISVVVDPGHPPYLAPWDVELHGPLDTAALEQVLRELTAEDEDRPTWRHRLLRHGPDHHTLRFSEPQGAPAALIAGRVADRLTRPAPVAGHPLTPAQCAALARPGRPGYEVLLIEPAVIPDPGALREALLTLVTAHPQLRSRHAAPEGTTSRRDVLVEAEFTGETGFTALLESVGRTLDAHTGTRIRALLARDRGTDGPRPDRLAVIVDELALDTPSRHLLLADLTTALTTPGGPAAPPPHPAGLADWVAELRALARDTAEARHWTLVAAHRPPTPAPPAAPRSEPVPAPHGTARRARCGTEFVLAQEPTERIVHCLTRQLALTTGQILTGAFALALARWQTTSTVGFDVHDDPRADRPNLRRYIGRLTEPYPVQLTLDPGLDPLGQLTALTESLAASAGRADAGAGFGACREWSPDPATRRALRDVPPAQTCLLLTGLTDLTGPGGPPPGPAQPTHPIDVRPHIRDGRLSITVHRTADPADHITDTSVRTLAGHLRDVLKELADTPAAPILPAFRATPQQTALYTGGDARPGTGRHVEQLVWVWHGPLDTTRFTASWQSVQDCETVLRTAFTADGEPLLVVHEKVTPDITRQTFHDGDWSTLLERDRLRGFRLHRPGALRVTLLEREPARPQDPTWILVTYHRALLDTRSANILLREFYRAYLADGTLPGGERRPDLRDYTTWAAAQDAEPARDLWSGTVPPPGAASWPGRSPGATGLSGTGHARLRLDPAETTRLAHWTATWGTTESSALQAVWALLIHWGSGAAEAAPVRFTVTVSGRGVLFDGAALMPGPLRNPLPMHVEVDPADTVPNLLRQLRDRALDMAAYEWVPEDWIHAWDGRGSRSTGSMDTVVVFEDSPHPVDGLEAELAAHGIKAEFPVTVPARCAPPVGLLAHHDSAGGLILTGVYDRALFDADTVAQLLAQSVMLLRTISASADEDTTVGEVLELLGDRAVPRPAQDSPARREGLLLTLRAARHNRAGTICLIPPPDAPTTCYGPLSDLYSGPQELLVLDAGAGADDARDALAAHGADGPLLLGGFSGAGALACDLARRIAEDGGRPPRVVLADTASDEQERARDLARALRDAGPPAPFTPTDPFTGR
ncbi:condensation domain-containing protein [Streptomyces qinzhouensis]|uniref:Condensation domain-containing protein n=1 Tax=Streptomyces qinzhouensis TaxID=2599401 RepID=A0A5B8J530_9ACTN|nr:condensation domain-containing protein [Streptomyces qinzhouensis]QDY75201.1 hypothetical protein FQU76_00375 [Streptomyces qinzhouensis]QDY80597.1 hypothetical protein FQU76_33365 [Streptomyces qinzhouensis]